MLNQDERDFLRGFGAGTDALPSVVKPVLSVLLLEDTKLAYVRVPELRLGYTSLGDPLSRRVSRSDARAES